MITECPKCGSKFIWLHYDLYINGTVSEGCGRGIGLNTTEEKCGWEILRDKKSWEEYLNGR